MAKTVMLWERFNKKKKCVYKEKLEFVKYYLNITRVSQ